MNIIMGMDTDYKPICSQFLCQNLLTGKLQNFYTVSTPVRNLNGWGNQTPCIAIALIHFDIAQVMNRSAFPGTVSHMLNQYFCNCYQKFPQPISHCSFRSRIWFSGAVFRSFS